MKQYVLVVISFFTLIMLALPQLTNAEKTKNIQDEIIYHIQIDRFNNGRQAPSDEVDLTDPYAYHGGDLQGIIAMLDTIQSYGFTAISLSPLMKSAPKGYHGYTIEDFYAVEEQFGTKEDLKKLVEEAHQRDIKVFMELVTNYLAETHPFVNDETKVHWFEEVSAKRTDSTKWLTEVVQLNQAESEVQSYLLDVAHDWVEETKIDGYVLHAAEQMNPAFLNSLSSNLKETYPHFYILAKSLPGHTIDYLCSEETIDALVDEQLLQTIQRVFAQADLPISTLYDTYQERECDRMLLLADDEHVPRLSNVGAEHGRNAITVWTLALTYLYTTPGTPMLYQGSEVPMYGPGFPENQRMVDLISADPDLKKVYERIAATRDAFPALVHGDYEQVAVDKGFSLFQRSLGDETVYVGINNDSQSRFVKLDHLSEDVQLRGLFHDDTIRMSEDGTFIVSLQRESADIFIVQPKEGFNWLFISVVLSIILLFLVAITYLTRKQKKREA